MREEYFFAGDCPVCGCKDSFNAWGGARRGDSSWGHDVMCCSTRCGKRYALWLKMGKVTKTTDCDPFSPQDYDEIEIKIHCPNESYDDKNPFEQLTVSESKLSLRAEINRLKRLVKQPTGSSHVL